MSNVVEWPDRGRLELDTQDPPPMRSIGDLVVEGALMLPHLLVLIVRLMRDPRVSLRRKLLVGAAVAYLVTPVDLIPDVIPVLGQADDVMLAAFAINQLITSVPPEIQRTYWEGSEDTFDIITSIVEWGADLVPRRLRRMFGSP